MRADFVDRECRKLPGAWPDQPFGPDTYVWKIGSKMFAAYLNEGDGVSVKCRDPMIAQLLIQLGQARSAPYLKRGAWVLLPWEVTSPSDLRGRLQDSYRIVRDSLSRAERDGMRVLD